MFKNWLILFLAAAFSQDWEVKSPDGNWNVRTTTQKAGPSVAVFNSSGRAVVMLDRDTTGSQRLAARWSPDSKKVVLIDQAPLGSGVIAAWYDGDKWHATVEPDSDLEQAAALAKSQGISGELKAEERKLGDWIDPDTIQVRGTLVYLGGKKFVYSYNLQVIPGSYQVNRVGFEIGGLKASSFQAH